MKKQIIYCTVIIGLMVSALILAGCDSTSAKDTLVDTENSATEEVVRDVRVAEVQSGDVEELLSRVSTIAAPNTVNITPETSGQIIYLSAEEGSSIRAGQIIAKLDATNAKLAEERALASSKKALHDLELARSQYEAKILNQEAVLQAEHTWEQSVRSHQQAEIKLAKCTIKAPVSGVITERMVSKGDTVFAGSPIAKLVDLSVLEAEVLVPQNLVKKIAVGQRVVLLPGSDTSRAFEGRVDRISPVVDPTKGTVAVAVRILSSKETIRPGQFVTAHIITGIIEQATLLPVESIVVENAMSVAYKVVDDRVRRVAIQVGFNKNGFVQVIGDISKDDKVVVSGHTGLDDMMRVNVMPSLAEVF